VLVFGPSSLPAKAAKGRPRAVARGRRRAFVIFVRFVVSPLFFMTLMLFFMSFMLLPFSP
jgi:hypothetical protein